MPHPRAAEIVRDIFTKVDEGLSPDRVARWLNKSGIQPWVQAGNLAANIWRAETRPEPCIQEQDNRANTVHADAQRTKVRIVRREGTMSLQRRKNRVGHSLLKPLMLATLLGLSGGVGDVFAQKAYITNLGSADVSVIDTAANTVVTTS